MASFPQASPPKPCIHFFFLLFVLHDPVITISFYLITRTIFGKEYRSLSSSLCSFLYVPPRSSKLFSNTLKTCLLFSYFGGKLCKSETASEEADCINIQGLRTERKGWSRILELGCTKKLPKLKKKLAYQCGNTDWVDSEQWVEDKNCAVLGCYAASSGIFLSTFRDSLSAAYFYDPWRRDR